MSEKEIWIGTFGPYIFDDDTVLDPDNETGSPFAGLPPKVINSDAPARIGAPVDPEDAARSGDVITSIQALNDVSTTDPTDGQALKWDSTNSEYVPYTPYADTDAVNAVESTSLQQLKLLHLSSDPSDPASGESVMWVSDGSGSGASGDLMIKTNVGGTIKTMSITDYSAN